MISQREGSSGEISKKQREEEYSTGSANVNLREAREGQNEGSFCPFA